MLIRPRVMALIVDSGDPPDIPAMNPIILTRPFKSGSIAAIALIAIQTTHADISGPYPATDISTLHLWHFDEADAPVADSILAGGISLAVLGEGATLGNTGFSGFGNALSTLDGGPNVAAGTGTNAYLAPLALANSAADNTTSTFADPTTGAFTFEAMIRLDFDPLVSQPTRNATMQIISGEQETTGGGVRSFQFRFDPVGVNPNSDGITTPLTTPALEFINLRNAAAGQVENRVVLLPVSGPHQPVQGEWYHVAVAYDGNAAVAGNLKFYWTKVDANVNNANLLGTKTLNNDLTPGAIDFAIGQIGRDPSRANFVGLIDEVRISKVARTDQDFIFFPDTDNDDLDDNWEILHFMLDGEDPVTDLAVILARQDGAGNPDLDAYNNLAEFLAGSDPNNIASTPLDIDADGLPDEWEMTEFGNLVQTATGDPDNDYNTNAVEFAASTDPESDLSWPDTDNSGVGDGLNDGWEVNFFTTITAYTSDQDPDNDGFTNLDEQIAKTHPLVKFSSPDTDIDGLADGWEVNYFIQVGETPLADLVTIIARYDGVADPDLDGSNNEAEETGGSDPNNVAIRPYDLDGDALVDAWELEHFSNTTAQIGSGNADGDAFTNAAEQAAGSDPDLTASTPNDTDGDGTLNSAETRVPYAVDSNTLHLWDLNGAATPVADRVYGPSNLSLLALDATATLGDSSFSGFGSALGTNAGFNTATGAYLAAKTAASGAADAVLTQLAAVDGAFSFEAMIRLDFDPLAVQVGNPPRMQIISAEDDNGQDANRIFQFAIAPPGSQANPDSTPRLVFINIDVNAVTAGEQPQTLEATVPASGDHAPVQGAWYHVAVTYDGVDNTAGNFKFYWTKVDSNAAAANVIGSLQMTGDLRKTAADFAIGNEMRDVGGQTGAFQGLIDQVRISDIARADSGFIFGISDPDTDDDNLPDVWENENFGNLAQTSEGDFDADGTANRAEFLLGLDPADGSSIFKANVSGSTVQWQGLAGLAFVVQRSETLAIGSWTDVSTQVGVDGTNSFTDPAPIPVRAFYRVLLVMP